MNIKNSTFDAKVLVIDDYYVNLDLAQDILEMMGCTVDVADNGNDALNLYQDNNYDLILLDIQMPTIDGYTVCKEIRSIEKTGGKEHTVVVALTANTMSGDRDKCLSAGMDDYIAKPLRLSTLEITLNKYLTNK